MSGLNKAVAWKVYNKAASILFDAFKYRSVNTSQSFCNKYIKSIK